MMNTPDFLYKRDAYQSQIDAATAERSNLEDDFLDQLGIPKVDEVAEFERPPHLITDQVVKMRVLHRTYVGHDPDKGHVVRYKGYRFAKNGLQGATVVAVTVNYPAP